MGINWGNPQIVQDNLVFCVDPQNYRSYIGSGTSVTDLSTNAETCTLVGGTGYSAPAFTLDGVNDYINADNVSPNINSDSVGTLMFWIKPVNKTPSSSEYLCSILNGSVSNNALWGFNGSLGNFAFLFRSSGVSQWQLEATTNPFSDNTWAHVALVQDGVSPVLYIDGASEPITFTITTDKTQWFTDITLDTILIGAFKNGAGAISNTFEGSKGTLCYYNTNLSAAQVLQNYNATKDIYL